MNGNGNSGTVAVQRDTGSLFTNFECHTSGLFNGLELILTQPPCSTTTPTATGTPPTATPTSIACPILWTLQATYPTPIAGSAVVALNGKVFSFGGGGSGATANSYIYDPNANVWTAIVPLPSARG